jgi:uroporphyrinogen-III synthase
MLELRGHAATYDGRVVALAPGPLAVLKALAVQPGRVRSRRELLAVLPGDGDEHAVEMTVTRLRAALGDRRAVQTVVKRGYRLRATAEATP